MIKIAITGGIGSGKSTAAEEIKKLGYKCFSADEIYKHMLTDDKFVCDLSDYMGVKPLSDCGKFFLDKKAVSALVFSDKTHLKKLNDYTHPLIMNELIGKMESLKTESIVFAEVPLLFECGYDKLFDFVFIITRSDDKRTEGTMLRDGKTKEEVEKVISNQFSYDKIAPEANIEIINNDGTVQELKNKLTEAIGKIIKHRN